MDEQQKNNTQHEENTKKLSLFAAVLSNPTVGRANKRWDRSRRDRAGRADLHEKCHSRGDKGSVPIRKQKSQIG